jgi:hypothetical protein
MGILPLLPRPPIFPIIFIMFAMGLLAAALELGLPKFKNGFVGAAGGGTLVEVVGVLEVEPFVDAAPAPPTPALVLLPPPLTK